MVFIGEMNAFGLRQFVGNCLAAAEYDPFKARFAEYLGIEGIPAQDFNQCDLPLYPKCAISVLKRDGLKITTNDLERLLGQASKIDGTPMSWVSDVFGVMSIKWLVEDQFPELEEQFQSWFKKFIPSLIQDDRLSQFERDIARYINGSPLASFSTTTIPVFLCLQGRLEIGEELTDKAMISNFMSELKAEATQAGSALLLSTMAYCFDKISASLAMLPPNAWSLNDVMKFLERMPAGLKRWTIEEKPRTKNATPVTWEINNEYHVQNLLYAMLAPIFENIADEINLPQIGQKNPRADLYLPGPHIIIEVKYRKNSKKGFSNLVGEVAEDASLYRANEQYADAKIICFLWDHTRASEEHPKFKEGVLQLPGIDGCVVINSPSSLAKP